MYPPKTREIRIYVKDLFQWNLLGKLHLMVALENDYEKVRKSSIIIVKKNPSRKSGDFSVTLSITKIDAREV